MAEALSKVVHAYSTLSGRRGRGSPGIPSTFWARQPYITRLSPKIKNLKMIRLAAQVSHDLSTVQFLAQGTSTKGP